MSKQISVLSIEFHNFGSIKHEKITLPQTPGLRFLGGKNLAEPKLGANGTGKSTLWRALSWCFFGSGRETSNFLSWGSEETSVSVILQVNNDFYFINRKGPPNKLCFLLCDSEGIGGELDANGKLIAYTEQTSLEALLGLNKLCFQHSVIFAQGQRLFPDLTIPERGELLEEVLNLTFWSKCSDAASTTLVELAKKIDSSNLTLAALQGQFSSLDSLESILAKKETWETEFSERLATLGVKSSQFLTSLKLELANLFEFEREWKERLSTQTELTLTTLEKLETEQKVIADNLTNSEWPDMSEIERRCSAKLLVQANLKGLIVANQHRIASLQKSFDFWDHTDSCDICKQPITAEHKKATQAAILEEQKELFTAIDSLKIQLFAIEQEIKQSRENQQNELFKLTALNNLKVEYNRLTPQITKIAGEAESLLLEKERSPYITQIAAAKTRENPYEQQIRDLQKSVNPWVAILEENKVKRLGLSTKLEDQQKVKQRYEGKATQIEYWKNGFKRLRVFLMHRVLTTLTIEINSAINALGLDGWKIVLKSETETKSGTVKLGIQTEIANPQGTTAPWESFSGGESQRLRLAQAFGVASLIQRASGTRYNLEVFDEPSTHLSSEGVEHLMETLDYRAESTKKPIWVTDHSALTYSNFSQIWTAVKDLETGTHFEIA